MAKIKTLIPFTTIVDGEYFSPRKGEILDVGSETAEQLIEEGLAEEYNLVEPTGKITITQNGTDIDVAQYATADVNVPASAVVSGTKSITENGSGIDVTNYATADVAVPASAVVSGTKSITANGSGIDVTNYAAVNVNVAGLETSQIQITNNTSSSVQVSGLTSEEIRPDTGEPKVNALVKGSQSYLLAGSSRTYKGWFWFNNSFVGGAAGVVWIGNGSLNVTSSDASLSNLGSGLYFVSKSAVGNTVHISIDPAGEE